MLTLKWIISTLRIDGWNAKGKVVNALENASVKELQQLRRSVNEAINEKRGMNDDRKVSKLGNS